MKNKNKMFHCSSMFGVWRINVFQDFDYKGGKEVSETEAMNCFILT